jgi:hypothetical protein
MMYDYFNEIYAFTQCDYLSYIDPSDNRSCIPCAKGTFSLDNPATVCYDLDGTIPDYLQTKAAFVSVLVA